MFPFSEKEMPFRWIFQHTSRITKKRLMKNLTELDWSSHSPELNPIGHLWGILDRRI